jgi:hypothetical protein
MKNLNFSFSHSSSSTRDIIHFFNPKIVHYFPYFHLHVCALFAVKEKFHFFIIFCILVPKGNVLIINFVRGFCGYEILLTFLTIETITMKIERKKLVSFQYKSQIQVNSEKILKLIVKFQSVLSLLRRKKAHFYCIKVVGGWK